MDSFRYRELQIISFLSFREAPEESAPAKGEIKTRRGSHGLRNEASDSGDLERVSKMTDVKMARGQPFQNELREWRSQKEGLT